MKFGVVIFPGSNCDRDTLYAFEHVMNHQAVPVWHKDKNLPDVDCIVLPGGFSYGDYLRSGAIARFSPVMQSVIEFANNGGYVLGICNGFQILCESHLLPGALLHNAHQQFVCKNVFIKPEQHQSALTASLRDRAYKLPVAHGEGRFYADTETLEKLNRNKQVLFRYCDADGNITPESNPNGATESIAGICNANGNVFGLMPHPERACEDMMSNTDGRAILESLVNAVQSVAQPH